ncbi:MAG: methylenetetrahydromethanopterin dehydrogenase, partial [Mesorhizobium sp.]
KVEKALEKKFERGLKDTRIAVFGATGVVGFCTAVIAAREGAGVTLVGHDGIARVEKIAAEIKSRFNIAVDAADGSSDARKPKLVEASEVILA